MSAYSFLDIVGSIVGPGGLISIGNGTGSAKEGIEIKWKEDKNKQTIGADGTAMNVLSADDSAEVSVKLLRTSTWNALLQIMYNYQKSTALLWGKNHSVFTDMARGDFVTLADMAFKKCPGWDAKEAPDVVEWTFDVGKAHVIRGIGTPEI